MQMPEIKNLTQLAEFLKSMDNSEKAEAGFDMQYDYFSKHNSSHECGTAMCIGGWVYAANIEGFAAVLSPAHPAEAVAGYLPSWNLGY